MTNISISDLRLAKSSKEEKDNAMNLNEQQQSDVAGGYFSGGGSTPWASWAWDSNGNVAVNVTPFPFA
jgi:hypothetical protein